MESFFARRVEKLFRLSDQDAEKLALIVFPKFLLEIIRKYLRIEVEGLENIPRRGKAVVVPNHSGCAGIDAVMLGYLLNEKTGRIPRILTLWNFFKAFPLFEPIAEKLGLKEASTDNGIQLLKKNHMLVVFPEGEAGSFKPSSERYKLQRFHTGFVRMAILTGAPIIPCVIIGAEETNINLATLKLSKFVRPMLVPIPFNLLPLPAKWKITFLKPIHLSDYSHVDINNKLKLHGIAADIRLKMQVAVEEELKQRKYVYFPTRQQPNSPEI